jgi:phosphotriesterase-related protein
LGSISPDRLGFTQPHEHLLCNAFWVTGVINNLLNDEDLAVEEALLFKESGGSSLVELTNIGLHRDPEALKRIAERTGLNVIMGCGWYRQPYYPEEIDRRSTNDLAAEMIRDLTVGVGGTGLKAGIIGEIGVNLDYMTAQEERVLRAAARAHKATGAAISLHGEVSPIGLVQLDVLEEEGVDLRKVIVGHADSYLRLDYHEAIAERGAYVQYDGIGRSHIYPDKKRVSMLAEMIGRGHVERLLLSTDRCWRSDLHAYGGLGYDHILVNFIPMLKEAGISDEQVDIMTVENPKRVLPF